MELRIKRRHASGQIVLIGYQDLSAHTKLTDSRLKKDPVDVLDSSYKVMTVLYKLCIPCLKVLQES